MAKETETLDKPVRKRRKARTAWERDSQMIRLAVDKVEERMLNGTASSQEYVHYLRLAANRECEQLEKEKKELELELIKAKTDALKASGANNELYSMAIRALGVYRGDDHEEDSDV